MKINRDEQDMIVNKYLGKYKTRFVTLTNSCDILLLLINFLK